MRNPVAEKGLILTLTVFICFVLVCCGCNDNEENPVSTKELKNMIQDKVRTDSAEVQPFLEEIAGMAIIYHEDSQKLLTLLIEKEIEKRNLADSQYFLKELITDMTKKSPILHVWLMIYAQEVSKKEIGRLRSELSETEKQIETLKTQDSGKEKRIQELEEVVQIQKEKITLLIQNSESEINRLKKELDELKKDNASSLIIPPPASASASVSASDSALEQLSKSIFEDFSEFKDGDDPGWGDNVYVKKGTDGQKWLITSLEGSHTVGNNVDISGDCYIEFDFVAQFIEAISRVYGVPSSISLVDEEGTKYHIKWQISKDGHTFILPDGASNTLNVGKTKFYQQSLGKPDIFLKNGTLRILKTENMIKVLVDGQLAISGKMTGFKRFVRFETDVYREIRKEVYSSGELFLFFTNFKVEPL